MKLEIYRKVHDADQVRLGDGVYVSKHEGLVLHLTVAEYQMDLVELSFRAEKNERDGWQERVAISFTPSLSDAMDTFLLNLPIVGRIIAHSEQKQITG